jgi:hypothetical protein
MTESRMTESWGATCMCQSIVTEVSSLNDPPPHTITHTFGLVASQQTDISKWVCSWYG